MDQRGRKSAVALAVVGDTVDELPALRPPGHLTEPEREVWLTTVNSKPASWFGNEHIPLLVQYVTQVCRSRVIDAEIRAFDPEWMKSDEGLRRYERLVSMSTKVAMIIKVLATSMRITHASTYTRTKAPQPVRERRPWQTEQE